MQLCSLSITYACPYHNPTMGGILFSKLTPENQTPTWNVVKLNRDSSVKGTLLQRCQWPSKGEHLCTEVSYDARNTVRSRPWWGWRAHRLASLRLFLQKLFSRANPVSSAVRVAGLRQSRRWRSRLWRSWAGVVTCGLRLWGQLDVLPNSLKLWIY
jgi:hypothetical protein